MLARALKVNLDDHLVFVDPGDVAHDANEKTQHLLGIIQNKPFTDYELRPQWRLWVMPAAETSSTTPTSFYIAFATSHALADGMSSYAFHRTFSGALSSACKPEGDSDPIWIGSPVKDILPPLDRDAKLPISWSFLLRPALAEFLPAFLAKALGVKDRVAEDAWYGSSIRPGRDGSTQLLRTKVHVASVSQATLQRVLDLCRKHHARLTALLNHLTAHALAEALHKRGQSYHTFVAETAVDLRSCIPQAHDEMANYPSAVDSVIKLPSDSASKREFAVQDWNFISQSTKRLRERSDTLVDQPTALLSYLSNFEQWVSKRAAQPAKESFGMSNLGVFAPDATTTNDLDVTQMVFSQSADGTGPPLDVNVASVKDGPLTLTMTWWPGMLGVEDEDAFAGNVLTNIVAQLERIAEERS